VYVPFVLVPMVMVNVVESFAVICQAPFAAAAFPVKEDTTTVSPTINVCEAVVVSTAAFVVVPEITT
jgi:hypothetical protein